MSSLQHFDPEVWGILDKESKRQQQTIDLIASENYPSEAIYEAQSSILTSKYAEGYPHKRYYGGCENADAIEELAVERLKKLYKAEYANVQPHSGAQANMAVYMALIKPGDTVMGMKLAHGGHLTHGAEVNFSGRIYNFVTYGVRQDDERIDYDEVERLSKECQPKIIVAGASAYPRFIDFERFRQIADAVRAKFMVDMAHTAGMIAAGMHPSPVPYADIVTSTTHKTLRGPRGGIILAREELGSKIDSSVFPRTQGGPMMHTIAAKAVSFYEALQPEFAEYQKKVVENAFTMAEEFKKAGLRLVSDGTDTHLIMADLTALDVTGKDAEDALVKSNIVANRDPIPFDTRPALVTSGIRFGTPAVTTRGMGKDEMKQIVSMIMRVLKDATNESVMAEVKAEVIDLCSRFPVPGVKS